MNSTKNIAVGNLTINWSQYRALDALRIVLVTVKMNADGCRALDRFSGPNQIAILLIDGKNRQRIGVSAGCDQPLSSRVQIEISRPTSANGFSLDQLQRTVLVDAKCRD